MTPGRTVKAICCAAMLALSLFHGVLFASHESVVPHREYVSDFEARLERARILSYQDSTLNEALAEYELLLKQAPENKALLLELSRIYIRLKRYQEARGALDRLLRIAPDDHAARLERARILSYQDSTLHEALTDYAALLKQKAFDRTLLLEASRVHFRLKQFPEARNALQRILVNSPGDSEALLEVAGVDVAQGHAKNARKAYAQLVDGPRDDASKLRFAEHAVLWGAYYQAERIYRAYLTTHPDDEGVRLRLAALLANSGRYYEAEGVYLRLLKTAPESAKALEGFVVLKLLEKKFDEALAAATELVNKAPDAKALLLKADVLFASGKRTKAFALYEACASYNPADYNCFLGMGKAKLASGAPEAATDYFTKARLLAPGEVEPEFYLNVSLAREGDLSTDLIRSAREQGNQVPSTILKWAAVFAAHGHYRAAERLYETVLSSDPDNFPARIGLAEVLASAQQYEKALWQLQGLEADFPENRRILLLSARILGWSKQYEKSIAVYDRIITLSPGDPVPMREKARVAAWANQHDKAAEYYLLASGAAVDQKLVDALASMDKAPSAQLAEDFERLKKLLASGTFYQGYELLLGNISFYRQQLSSDQSNELERVLVDLLPLYKIQKALTLESRAKNMAWHGRLTQALEAYRELIAFEPGNEEALADYAQVQCALGLGDCAVRTYEKLLELYPLYGGIADPLEKGKILQHPFLELDYAYWNENGRGALSQITRGRLESSVAFPFIGRYQARFSVNTWLEHPMLTNTMYAADGYSLEFKGVFNQYGKGEAKWTHKEYDEDAFGATDTGYGRIWFNLRDYAQLGLSYDRTDELYNYFGLKQGIQADAWNMSLSSFVTRRFEVKGRADALRYNDGNSGGRYSVSGGYAFTDHPHIFKAILSGEYRDTKAAGILKYEGAQLADIEHPYWTPVNYSGTRLTFEWYHDLSQEFFCGNDLHYYDIRFSLGTDSESNSSLQWEGEWHVEIRKHLTFGLRALTHRSREWDAEELWGMGRYQF